MKKKNNDSIFSKIIRREVPSRIAYEDKNVIVIWDIDQTHKDHLLSIWKEEYVNLFDLPAHKIKKYFKITAKFAKKFIKNNGYKAFKILMNNGVEANQVVMHCHIHIFPF
ncbi:HIT family protein [Mycoplasma phocimorsus]|uniref:HIT family protein n=1 Tax=Mycoplasma phocimorsus TaxID=3045839 RepID=A0AAJ1UVV5_9MOLU|nr:HIT family protein [Mycoplasma phocimorsus]MDJ1645944.1 HIT family protein [Mycoplasma phocimorsus]MDJ1646541.1 HIT family protein [Mycoplasma phocimorsus]MDJ1647198.1 HIT family protein [Mycoplasma phocimorsus]MDJ1647347.1 HIT family protein [Mycoplasma phocimorsus]MDJ1648734.1 HIT family protein [Mycoplasma phocimorsus]